MNFQLRQSPLRYQFFIWSTLIVIAFCCLFTFINYKQMRKNIMDNALRQSELILHEVEAIRKYVSNVIRPKAYELTDEDEFIIEMMSTTYVSLQIMDIFKQDMKDYSYRRVSSNPRNEKNLADSHEEEMAAWFNSDRNRTFWQGMVEKDGNSYFTSMIPDYISNDCLYCHGDPSEAPTELIQKYGDKRGFGFEEGDLAGVNSISIPITDSLNRLYNVTIITFLSFLLASALLLFVLNLLFDKLIISKLTKVIASVDKGQSKTNILQTEKQEHSDELDTLRESVNQLACYVQTAQKGGKQLPNFIGPYLVEKPLLAGTLSWLYTGSSSKNGDRFLMKIPFDSLVENPVYRTFYKTELKIFRHHNHQGLLNFTEVIGNVMIGKISNQYKPLGRNLSEIREAKRLFSALFELVAYLHTQSLVHHNIVPEIFLATDKGQLLLTDHGLSWWNQVDDDLHYAKLGPQGSISYIPPEQLKGFRGDSRSDIYSLGIWLYSYFTGELPFQEEGLSRKQIMAAKESRSFLALRENELDGDVFQVLQKALNPQPEMRYQWVEDLRDDIIGFIPKDRRL